MKYLWAFEGNKVICINGEWGSNAKEFTYCITFPEYKKIYTIRSIKMIGEEIGLRFVEIINPDDTLLEFDTGHIERGEVAFDIAQFKPLEKKTLDEDISIFKKLITKIPERID